MIVQRFFALKGCSVLYVDKEKADSVPESIRDHFKQSHCGEGDVGSFPEKIKVPLVEQGYFVDDI